MASSIKHLHFTVTALIFFGFGCRSGRTGDGSEAKDALITVSGDVITLERPWNEVLDSEKDEAMHEALKLVAERVVAANVGNPDGSRTAEELQNMSISTTIADGNRYLYNNIDELADHGLTWTDVVPTGFFFLVGGKFTANIKLAAGGSADAIIIVLPRKVIRTIKGTRQVTEHWRFKVNLAFIATGDPGVGIGGGAATRVGAGLIWGELNDPSEFRGPVAGVSATTSFGVGIRHRLMVLKRNSSSAFQNILYSATYEWGANAEVGVFGHIGLAVPITSVMQQLGLGAGDLVSRPKVIRQ